MPQCLMTSCNISFASLLSKVTYVPSISRQILRCIKNSQCRVTSTIGSIGLRSSDTLNICYTISCCLPREKTRWRIPDNSCNAVGRIIDILDFVGQSPTKQSGSIAVPVATIWDLKMKSCLKSCSSPYFDELWSKMFF
ncbi:CLUMA_CG008250, isoform A [Clunio marinus]|uniref:CLUMA_CG008250, isoform A n=1 Tax=Clunio marinus TaxID=568069 RepID=A0A1J1I592_9DIPT|nr:CLUMA_CG008250, isoform A [Clunio marinus]